MLNRLNFRNTEDNNKIILIFILINNSTYFYLLLFKKGSSCFGYRKNQKTYPTLKNSFKILRMASKPDMEKQFLFSGENSFCRAKTVYYVDDSGKNVISCNYQEEYFDVFEIRGYFNFKVSLFLIYCIILYVR